MNMKMPSLLLVAGNLLFCTLCLGQQIVTRPPASARLGLPPTLPTAEDQSSSAPVAQAALTVGDTVVLELRDKIAVAYLRLLDVDIPNDVPNGSVGASLDARVIKSTSDNVVAEYHVVSKPDTDAARVITVTATLPRNDIQSPSPYRPYSQPSSSKVTEMQKQILNERERLARLPFVRIDTFDKTKIRAWTLERDVNK